MKESGGAAPPAPATVEPAPAVALAESVFRSAGLLRANLNRSTNANQARLAALRVICDSPNGCSQTQLARQLNRSESGVSELVGRMRRDGLLYRMRSKHDARTRMLMLSERGRRMVREIEQKRERQLAVVFADVGPDRLAALAKAMRQLCDTLADFAADEPASQPPGAVPAA